MENYFKNGQERSRVVLFLDFKFCLVDGYKSFKFPVHFFLNLVFLIIFFIVLFYVLL